MSSQRLSTRTLLAYASPGFGASLLIPPFPALIAAFYALHTDATAAGIAAVLLVSRLFDGFTDPAMGYLTDRTRTPFGPRKPWIALGALLGVVALYVIFIPPDGAGDVYLLGAFLLFYLAYTLINIPLRSWGSDLSIDYKERSKISSWLVSAYLVGGLLFMFLPVILSLPAVGFVESAELNKPMMAIIGFCGMVILPIAVTIGLVFTPQGRRVGGETSSVWVIWRDATRNRPFVLFLAACALSGLSFGSFYAVVLLALSNYFGFAAQIPLFLVVLTLAQVLSIPLWVRVASAFGKHRTWGYAWLGHALMLPLIWWFEPGSTSFLSLLIYGSIVAILQAPNMVFPMSMLSDIIDYDTLKSNEVRAGSYFSLMSVVNKSANAVGSALGFYVIAIFGYDPKSSENSEWANFGLLLASNGIPAVVCLLAVGFLLAYPLDERRYGIIRRRLQRRSRGSVPK